MVQRLARIERVLQSGSTFPSLVTSESGHRYVLKLAGAGPGTRSLATEYVALKLAEHLGLNVPAPELIEVPRQFPWQTGTDEFYETVQRSAGWNLAVAFVPNARDLGSGDLDTLPIEFLSRLAGVDALLQNFDRSAANPNILRDFEGQLWGIDFGACLFIERLSRQPPEPNLDLPSNHFLSPRHDVAYSARDMARAIALPILDGIAAALPRAWLDDLGVSSQDLAKRLTAYIEHAWSA